MTPKIPQFRKKQIVITPTQRFEIKFAEEPDVVPLPVADVPQPKPSPIAPTKLYQCSTCHEQFERSYQLKRHTFVAHTNGRQVAQNRATPVVELSPKRSAVSPMCLSRTQTQSHPVQSIPQVNRFVQIKSPLALPLPAKPSINIKSPSIVNGNTTCPVPQRKSTTNPQKPLNTASSAVQIKSAAALNAPAPRVIVRKEAAQPVKFNQTTQNESSQIFYKVPPNGTAIRYTCAACDTTYADLALLDRHLQCHNGQLFRYKCELCDDFVASVPHLRNHVHAHTCSSQLAFKCDRCECRFPDDQSVLRHWCLSQNAFDCYVCRKSFLTDSLFRSHQFVHTRVKPYKCNACDVRFIHLSALFKHQECETSCGSLYPHEQLELQ